MAWSSFSPDTSLETISQLLKLHFFFKFFISTSQNCLIICQGTSVTQNYYTEKTTSINIGILFSFRQ
jgi:hypothetical protein